jgi:hypothetical protein
MEKKGRSATEMAISTPALVAGGYERRQIYRSTSTALRPLSTLAVQVIRSSFQKES